jgi:hypothetical protein
LLPYLQPRRDDGTLRFLFSAPTPPGPLLGLKRTLSPSSSESVSPKFRIVGTVVPLPHETHNGGIQSGNEVRSPDIFNTDNGTTAVEREIPSTMSMLEYPEDQERSSDSEDEVNDQELELPPEESVYKSGTDDELED